MKSADSRLIPLTSSKLLTLIRLSESRSDLRCHHTQWPAQPFDMSFFKKVNFLPQKEHLKRFHVHVVFLVWLIMIQHGSGDACPLVGESDAHHVQRPPLEKLLNPPTGSLCAGQHTARTMNQQCAQIGIPRLLIPSSLTFPPEPVCFGTRPTQAANARPDLHALALPIVATAAVAVSMPTPCISVRDFAA